MDRFSEDSFFTLDLIGRVGLVALSLLMLALLAWMACVVMRRCGGLRGTLIMTGVYWLFLWVAPQVYYLYYQTIFDGLPWQIVIRAPLGGREVFERVTLWKTENLSEISQGLGYWIMLGVGLVCARHRRSVRG